MLLALASAALRTVRYILDRVRLRLPSSLRHGLANLYRPGNQSAAVLAALGTGIMLILAVYLMQADLLRDLRETASPKLPNVFLVDIRTSEVAGVRAFFAHQPGVTEPLDVIPVVMGRFVAINGTPVEDIRGHHYPMRMLESADSTGPTLRLTATRSPQAHGGAIQTHPPSPSATASPSACNSPSAQPWSLKPAIPIAH